MLCVEKIKEKVKVISTMWSDHKRSKYRNQWEELRAREDSARSSKVSIKMLGTNGDKEKRMAVNGNLLRVLVLVWKN